MGECLSLIGNRRNMTEKSFFELTLDQLDDITYFFTRNGFPLPREPESHVIFQNVIFQDVQYKNSEFLKQLIGFTVRDITNNSSDNTINISELEQQFIDTIAGFIRNQLSDKFQEYKKGKDSKAPEAMFEARQEFITDLEVENLINLLENLKPYVSTLGVPSLEKILNDFESSRDAVLIVMEHESTFQK